MGEGPLALETLPLDALLVVRLWDWDPGYGSVWEYRVQGELGYASWMLGFTDRMSTEDQHLARVVEVGDRRGLAWIGRILDPPAVGPEVFDATNIAG